jgi:Tat protein translocase TatB subunit
VLNLGWGEITLILVLALIFIGPKKLPDLAAGLGKLIREIRKATSDVKNEIALDDTFRKPFEELRDAVTLHPEELKRRDQWAREREEAAKRAAEEAAREAAAAQPEGPYMPPDGLADHVKIDDPSKLPSPGAKAEPAAPRLPEPNGPNATIVQPVPGHATLDDIPTPPPDGAKAEAAPVAAARPSLFAPVAPPPGTVARPAPQHGPTAAPVSPAAEPPAAAPPQNGEAASNTTQILREEDLIPTGGSGKPPPPPHLPGLRPPSAPRPVVNTPSPPLSPIDKKKA